LNREASIDGAGKAEFESSLSRSLNAPSQTSLLSEIEDDNVIHVDEPGSRYSKVTGGEKSMELHEDLGMYAETGGEDDDYGAPILASDEVAKEPFGWELQPAVSPINDRRGSSYDERSGSVSSLNGSRPSSRPGSIHGTMQGLRFPETTPLEDLDEYEPLFAEDEKHPASTQNASVVADRLKRPEVKSRKFPSQDIWEDTPDSLQYTATVSTPQLPEEVEELKEAPETETAAQAFARRQEELAEKESRDSESFLNREAKPWAHKANSPPHLAAETRPGMKQRFPSRDIWEDTPDSLQLETTVAGPQSDDIEILSPQDAEPTTSLPLTTGKPQIPARPAKSKLSESPEKSHPVVPERPSQKLRQLDGAGSSPPLPAKSKPLVPARPSKPVARESSENIPLTTVASNSSAKSIGSDNGAVGAAKPKPPVPTRPMGGKIAALQGGFMSDLNKRLQLGPQAPKKEEATSEEKEEEKEKTPLVDARKGRARGPARRAPAKSPAPATSALVSGTGSTLAFSIPAVLWEIDPEEDLLHVSSKDGLESTPSVSTKAIESETPTLATNVAGEAVHGPSEILEGDGKASLAAAFEDAHAVEAEDIENSPTGAEAAGSNHESEPVKASDEPPIAESTLASEALDEEEDLSASVNTLKPSRGEE
jgi:hypothetical protein